MTPENISELVGALYTMSIILGALFIGGLIADLIDRDLK